jgi:hypothetical protein
LAGESAMSAPRQSITVSRIYEPEPEHCAHALEILLKASVRQEDSPNPTVPDDAKVGFKRDSRAT